MSDHETRPFRRRVKPGTGPWGTDHRTYCAVCKHALGAVTEGLNVRVGYGITGGILGYIHWEPRHRTPTDARLFPQFARGDYA